jgi:hypothetical protein
MNIAALYGKMVRSGKAKGNKIKVKSKRRESEFKHGGGLEWLAQKGLM